MSIKTKTLIQLAGKAITREIDAKYCHVERVMRKEELNAVVMAWYKNFNNAWRYLVAEVEWTTDSEGKHTIIEVSILKEGEVFDVDGELERQAYTTDRAIQRAGERFSTQARNDADVPVYSGIGIPRW